ncbi:FAD-dependent monooxygenase [Paraburkholderia sediminicola]|uniref:FAD-dependent monooxygenase n=1 Tax=Paraburkholderia sediminicola TaxID=458836 RepID=UPI0038BE1AA3
MILNLMASPAKRKRVSGALTFEETQETMRPMQGPLDDLPTSTDVLIVGAGPIGLTAANVLGRLGVNVVLLEKNDQTSELPKAIAVDDEYMRLLDVIGLAAPLEAHRTAPFGIHFMSPLGFALVKVPGFTTPNGFGIRSAVLQPVLEKILLDGARRYESVKIRYASEINELSQHGETIAVKLVTDDGTSRMISAKYLLGCDGARSFVRQHLGIKFDGSRISEPHLVIDAAEFPDQSPYSRFFCNPRRPLNSIPAPYGGRRLEFMLMPGDTREEITSSASIRKLLDESSPYRGVDIKVIRSTVYGFSERIASELRVGRVFLLGDAAHVMPPFGGQGMNTGARDVANLSWKMVLGLRNLASDTFFDSYDHERRHHIRQIIDYSVRVGKVANIRSWPLALTRDLAFALINSVPAFRRYFGEMRYMPKPCMKSGFLVTDEVHKGGIVGKVFPRMLWQRTWGEETNIDQLAPYRFALIGVDLPIDTLRIMKNDPFWLQLDPIVILLKPHPNSTPQVASLSTTSEDDVVTVFSDDPSLFDKYVGRVITVRPDRYVAAVCRPSEFSEVTQTLAMKMRA